jgi:hypothetical protein
MVEQRTGINGVEEEVALLGLADIGINEKRVCLGMDVLHGDLESVEASCLWELYFSTETLNEVLVYNSVRSGEEGEDVRNEETFVIVELVVPVVNVLGQIDLLCCPEGGHGLLVHTPDLFWSACNRD